MCIYREYIMGDNDLIKLMEKEHTYPSPEESDFQHDIYIKREFYSNRIPLRPALEKYEDIKEYRDNICARHFTLHAHQSFLSNFINPDTPYRGVLLFHGTGTGKTCAAIAIGEKFKKMVEKYNTKIIVLVSGPLIKENWKNELIKCTGETYMKYHDANVFIDEVEKQKLKKNALNAALQYYKFMSYRSFYKKVLGERVIEKTTEDNKIKSTYKKTEDGEYERDQSVDKIDSLNNTIIIVDEAHNLTGNDYGMALKQIIDNSTNLKVVLLTATPMKNLADDIVELLNFLRPKDSPIQREKIFNNQHNHLMEFKEGGLEYLKKMSSGYISYLRGNDPITFAEKIEMGEVPDGLIFTKVVRCKMLKFQLDTYISATKDIDDALDKKSEAVANFVFPGLTADFTNITGYYAKDGINTVRNQLNDHQTKINNLIHEKILNNKNNESDDVNEYIYPHDEHGLTGSIFKIDNLKHFSIKFYTAINNLSKLVYGQKGPGTAFVYSNLVKVGIDLFQEILIQNGYMEYDENNQYSFKDNTICYFCGITHSKHNLQKGGKKHKISRSSIDIPEHEFKPATFISVTGKSEENMEIVPEDKQQILTNIFNHITNKNGMIIKFVLGSRVMNEGITLENVREVHILDVHYNLARVDQVIGRAVRHCKHYHITNDENRFPKVEIFKYVISNPNGELTTEEELYKKAELKYLLIKKTERGLKESAIDCPLFLGGNIFPEEVIKFKDCGKPGKLDCPQVCDYMNCEFKCDSKKLNLKYYDPKRNIYNTINKDNLDHSTFNNELARDEINFSKNKIKEIFKTSYTASLKDIIEYVKNNYPTDKIDLFDVFFVYKALDELIPISENDFNNYVDTILDKYNKPGYIIYRNKYYIFQPFDQNEDVPMYYRSKFDKPLLHKLSLFNYMKNTDIYKTYSGNNTQNEQIFNETSGYDFDSVMEYYDNKDENDIVGIIDKEMSRRKSVEFEEAKDVFKIRQKRSKILDKRRGTNIPTLKGAMCSTSSNKEQLIKIAKKIGIDTTQKMATRFSVCELIRDKLLHLEKYTTGKNKVTYVMIPANHPLFPFPYNLEDRKDYIIKKITDTIKFDLSINTNQLHDKNKNIYYEIIIKNDKKLNQFDSFLKTFNAKLEKDNIKIIVA